MTIHELNELSAAELRHECRSIADAYAMVSVLGFSGGKLSLLSSLEEAQKQYEAGLRPNSLTKLEQGAIVTALRALISKGLF